MQLMSLWSSLTASKDILHNCALSTVCRRPTCGCDGRMSSNFWPGHTHTHAKVKHMSFQESLNIVKILLCEGFLRLPSGYTIANDNCVIAHHFFLLYLAQNDCGQLIQSRLTKHSHNSASMRLNAYSCATFSPQKESVDPDSECC